MNTTLRAPVLALVLVLLGSALCSNAAPSTRVSTVPQDFKDDSPFEALWTPFEGTTPAHWRVVWHDDPTTAASICWSTREVADDTQLLLIGPRPAQRGLAPADFDAPPGSGELAARSFTPRSGAYTPGDDEGDAPLGQAHWVRLSGLEPNSRYDFAIVSGDECSRTLYFHTAPESGVDFEVLYGGDSRSGWRDRCRVNLMIAQLVDGEAFPLCFVHGGDYVENGGTSAEWIRWLSHHELTTGSDGRVLPLLPARGNHDWGPCYAQVFDHPGRTLEEPGAWFRTDLGGDVSILHLDTNVPVLGDQFVWLEAQLPRARESSRWLVLNYHRPMFPAVKEPSAAAPFWVPTFERHDVDLVFESDGHVMKRTVAIRDGEPDPTGVTYLGEGGLGVPQRRPDSNRWPFEGGFTGRGHHASLVRFEAERLVMRFVVLDEPGDALGQADAFVPFGATWRYLAGRDPDARWFEPDFDDAAWPVGRAGFGYGDGDDATILDDMRDAYTRVRLRHVFDADPTWLTERAFLLGVDHDDGFVAWLNGVEIARSAIDSGSGPDARGVQSHEAGTATVFELSRFEHLLRPTGNVLAVEGHNRSVGSSDFSLHPGLFAGRAPTNDPTQVSFHEADEHVLPRRR